MIRTYSELIQIPSFIERFRYLKLGGRVGQETYGYERWINQWLYQHNREWHATRRKAILRDNACDLACEDRPTFGRLLVHHMNPITKEDILDRPEYVFDLEYLITTIQPTHNAIHYGDETLLIPDEPIIRRPNDTCPWR